MDPLEQLPIPLLEWYRDNARRLPWRDDPTPYHVWVSEIMLQQTRVAAVLDYYRRFLAEVPDVAALAALPEERLLKLWQGLGYYNRARNLQAAARQIVEEHGGVFPSDYESVRALKGVGDYTAGAICSIAFGQPVPAVDGNVLRVVARLTGDNGDITTPAMKKRVAEQLGRVIPLRAPGAFTQAMMELGATVCLPNGAPLCEHCPAGDFCAARLEGRSELRTLFCIVLPNMKSTIASLGILLFINSWNEYVWPTLILRTEENYTLSLAMQLFSSAEGGTDFTVVMAMAVVSMLIPVLLYLIFQRYIMSTFASSGIKG